MSDPDQYEMTWKYDYRRKKYMKKILPRRGKFDDIAN